MTWLFREIKFVDVFFCVMIETSTTRMNEMKSIEQASKAGYEAAMAGEMRAPALNATIRAIIDTNLNTHVETIQIYKSFIAGYEARVNDVMKELASL
jgi:hypothetical protein